MMLPSLPAQAEAAAPWLWILLSLLAVVATLFWLAGRGGENATIPPGKTTGRDDPEWSHPEFMDEAREQGAGTRQGQGLSEKS